MNLFQSTRPIRGATTYHHGSGKLRCYFNPRAPYGARRSVYYVYYVSMGYFNPRAPYGARRLSTCALLSIPDFNPRAPYGARRQRPGRPGRADFISIHAPHTGRDNPRKRHKANPKQFQSTRPIRGATGGAWYIDREHRTFQSTRPIRGATEDTIYQLKAEGHISIHAPHTGRDILPALGGCLLVHISIHAPHTGRDSVYLQLF